MRLLCELTRLGSASEEARAVVHGNQLRSSTRTRASQIVHLQHRRWSLVHAVAVDCFQQSGALCGLQCHVNAIAGDLALEQAAAEGERHEVRPRATL